MNARTNVTQTCSNLCILVVGLTSCTGGDFIPIPYLLLYSKIRMIPRQNTLYAKML